ncbi:MAG: ABC transporter substrate-binding protein [Planctomycetota bacterium]|nr:MAG: ABC transporter substrate-binding protein [Planctomycetota bacterium]
MSSPRTDALLGLVFFGALIGLGAVTIALSDFAFDRETFTIELYSEDVGYLRSGDPVLLHGMASGKVMGIERLDAPRVLSTRQRNPEQPPKNVETSVRITVRLDVDPFLHLKPDFQILIEDRGLLGGKLIRIEAGGAEGSVPTDTQLVAVASETVLQSAGSILEENRESLRRTMSNLESITDTVAKGEGTIGRLVNDGGVADTLERVLDTAGGLLDDVAAGEGTLGRLMTDDEIYEDLQQITGDLRGFTDRIARGEGTVGKLVQDDALYNNANQVFEDLTAVSEKLAAGEGTLGKLLTDDALHTDVSELASNLRELTDGLAEGKGSLGKMFQDDELYTNLNDSFGQLSELLEGVQNGDGLLAALISDEQLADDFRSIMSQVLGAIEDARETTPVQSVGSFLFGTF